MKAILLVRVSIAVKELKGKEWKYNTLFLIVVGGIIVTNIIVSTSITH
jgi:hypothetical protein